MKNILITGATDGLGKALTQLLSQNEEYNLILCGRNQTKMNQLINEIDSKKVIYYTCFDLLENSSITHFIQTLLLKNIQIDVLINNAGANIKKDKVIDVDIDQLHYMMQLNCYSHLSLIQGIYPQMKQRKSGHIINVLSSCCLYSNENASAYTASKNAMESFSKILCKEARLDHIKVTGVYPGGINTSFRSVENPTYLKPETVALAILNCIQLPEEANMHDLVIRPFSESNF